MGFAGNLRTEIRVYARFILDNCPGAKVGLLYQNDDSDKDYLTRLREALGGHRPTLPEHLCGWPRRTPPRARWMINMLYAAVGASSVTQRVPWIDVCETATPPSRTSFYKRRTSRTPVVTSLPEEAHRVPGSSTTGARGPG